jgi:hypothetical protein
MPEFVSEKCLVLVSPRALDGIARREMGGSSVVYLYLHGLIRGNPIVYMSSLEVLLVPCAAESI